MEALLGLASVFCGCQANVFSLELLTVSSPNTYYFLTFAQYTAVVLLSLPLMLRFVREEEEIGAVSAWPFRWRRRLLPLHLKAILSVIAWTMSVGNNIVFGLHISVPLHATFRSSALMLNMLAGYCFLGKSFTLMQVLCAAAICGGLIALAAEKSRKQSRGSADDASTTARAAEEYYWWMCGVAVLVCTTACSTALGIFQEYLYQCGRESEEEVAAQRRMRSRRRAMSAKTGEEEEQQYDDAAPMWAEALLYSHAIAVPLFFLQPQRLLSEARAVSPESYRVVFFNCVTQFVCVAGVYVMNNLTSAFTLTLTLTLRKLGSFVLSVIYFRHYVLFSTVEWVAMVGALVAGTAYPFLPKTVKGSGRRGGGGVARRSRSRSMGR